jgi:hypothetical protein
VGLAFTQVKAYITDEWINLTDVPVLVTDLETAFRNPDHVATSERKPVALKQANSDFSTYYTEFQPYAANVQWNNPAKCKALMTCLNNEIKDALTLSDNVPQQFQEFVAFLQRLNN